MTRPQAQVKQFLSVWLRFQNGEIEIVKEFKAKIAGKETLKGAILRLMKL